MARRVSKKKRPRREVLVISEQKKVEDIFDAQTMIYLSKFFNKGIISELQFKIARGKEADIYLASAGISQDIGSPYVILKFFRIENTSFPNMRDYIVGDPRFKRPGKSMNAIVQTWCRKEFGNLKIAKNVDVSAPTPYMFNGNILALEFIGDASGTPAPKLKDAKLENPRDVLDSIIDNIRKLYVRGLVHADVSEYNILINGSMPYMIDFGQAVSLKHPNAMAFLERDVRNIVHYFNRKYAVDADYEELLARIKANS